MSQSMIVDLPRLVPTSSGSATTNAIGHLDDAVVVSLFLVSTAAGAVVSSAGVQLATIQVSQFDPAFDSSASPAGASESTGYFSNLSTAVGSVVISSSGQVIFINPVFFRGLRLTGLSSATAADVTAYATKQIHV